MAQAMVIYEMIKKQNEKKLKHVATQTGEASEFCVSLSQNKNARLYHSLAYRDTVLSLNINNAKSFIFTKPMWKIFRNYIYIIVDY